MGNHLISGSSSPFKTPPPPPPPPSSSSPSLSEYVLYSPTMASLRRNSTLQEDVIQGWRDVKEAFRVTWQRQKNHLFTSWVHVPLGVMTLLVITWGLRLAIDLAPFRFPAPVIAMLIFFFLLLLLDWMSTRFPGQKQIDLEKTTADIKGGPKPKRRRRFVDPVMALLAPPCDFCLRNM